MAARGRAIAEWEEPPEGEKQGAHDAFAALRYYYRMSRGLPQDEEPEG